MFCNRGRVNMPVDILHSSNNKIFVIETFSYNPIDCNASAKLPGYFRSQNQTPSLVQLITRTWFQYEDSFHPP